MDKLSARAKGKRSKALGEALEKMTALELAAGGILASRIATPSTVIRGRRCWTEKVVGDFFGITATGTAVLVECKHRTGTDGEPRKPRPSDFEKHQVEALRAWHFRGGLAMVAWWGTDRKVQFVPAVDIVGRE